MKKSKAGKRGQEAPGSGGRVAITNRMIGKDRKVRGHVATQEKHFLGEGKSVKVFRRAHIWNVLGTAQRPVRPQLSGQGKK